MTFPKRYLVRFGPKQTQHLFTDLLIIGGGIAGLRARRLAACLRSMRVLVVTKDRVQISNSTYAQGGIAAVRSPEDRFEDHIEDTLTAGAGLCDRDVVDVVVRGEAFSAANRRPDPLRHRSSTRSRAWRAGTATTASFMRWATPPVSR